MSTTPGLITFTRPSLSLALLRNPPDAIVLPHTLFATSYFLTLSIYFPFILQDSKSVETESPQKKVLNTSHLRQWYLSFQSGLFLTAFFERKHTIKPLSVTQLLLLQHVKVIHLSTPTFCPSLQFSNYISVSFLQNNLLRSNIMASPPWLSY